MPPPGLEPSRLQTTHPPIQSSVSSSAIINGASYPTSRPSLFPKGSLRTPSALSPPERASPIGCFSSDSMPSAVFFSMVEPRWSDNLYPPIDFQSICYFSEPKNKPKLNSLDEVDPKILETFERLGIPLNEQKRLSNVAVDAVIDSTSIATTHREVLAKAGVIFCSISEAIRQYPDLVRRYIGKVVPTGDNYYAALNSAVFSDGSFCYIPKDTVSPMEISTYFRINDKETGQFERTLIIADERSYVSYLEGCTAPSYDKNQLHAAVVELYCAEGAEIKYSTVQNWYAGDEEGKGGFTIL
ncbi:hypothetical protein HPP92_023452 [Vanilla planifolia]|uniref:Uncharacterized protein n=1 Tax=Vanilla planifolia TaxID=51239 RepID=A0A835PV57_VANPL|nr:hypothetical protein HPP92_023452 [Vanilla planifolia]